MKKAELQEKLLEAYQIEDALRAQAKEAIDKLKEVHRNRLALEKMLNADPN